MIRPAKVRAIRAHLNETQEEFGRRFGVTRYVVMHWEKFGLVDQPALERSLIDLEGTDHDRYDTDPMPAPPSKPDLDP